MAIIDDFPEFLTAGSNERATESNDEGVVTETWADVDTFECLFWRGAAANARVSERFRNITDAAIAVYPETDIEEDDIIHVEGEKYIALAPDNIVGFDEVTIVAMKAFG